MGAGWELAWKTARESALRSACDPGDWGTVLDATEDEWESAYRRLGGAAG
jgi:hypothetical protein